MDTETFLRGFSADPSTLANKAGGPPRQGMFGVGALSWACSPQGELLSPDISSVPGEDFPVFPGLQDACFNWYFHPVIALG